MNREELFELLLLKETHSVNNAIQKISSKIALECVNGGNQGAISIKMQQLKELRDFKRILEEHKVIKIDFVATTEGYIGYKGNKEINFKAKSVEDARHFVINHLDCSCEWKVAEKWEK